MKRISVLFLMLSLLIVASLPAFAKESPDQTRATLDNMSEQVLERMYKAYPSAVKAVGDSYGYVTISGVGVKVGFWGSDHGRGVAVNRVTGERIYVKMKEASVGLNFGAKEFDLLFVVTNENAWHDLVFGNISVNSEASVAASDEVSGGSYADAKIGGRGLYIYQVDKKGLAVDLTLKGTRISPYRELNPQLYPKG